jgi:hypothetical protein
MYVMKITNILFFIFIFILLKSVFYNNKESFYNKKNKLFN